MGLGGVFEDADIEYEKLSLRCTTLVVHISIRMLAQKASRVVKVTGLCF